ncbi:MAG: hypothetical protein HZB80_00325 [Deltaproteobacteria bacterium]|nr:hypothetical protein [Deltaproteobacteria bacterium]
MIDDYFNDIIESLIVSHSVSSFKILRKELTEEDGYIRIKCNLSNGDVLEFAEYIVVHKDKLRLETYSYHWQGNDGRLIKRWDNVAHHKEVKTFRYHLHLADGRVIESVKATLKRILSDIGKTIIVNE